MLNTWPDIYPEQRQCFAAALDTNGTIWRMYEIQGRRTLRKSHCTEVNIQEWDRRPAAEQLHELLRRPQVPQQVPT